MFVCLFVALNQIKRKQKICVVFLKQAAKGIPNQQTTTGNNNNNNINNNNSNKNNNKNNNNNSNNTSEDNNNSSYNKNMTAAQHLIDYAAKEINRRNYDAAERILRKAEKLSSNTNAGELRKIIQKLREANSDKCAYNSRGSFKSLPSESEESAPTYSSTNSSVDNSPMHRSKRKQQTKERYGTFKGRDYTESQIELVRKIYDCKNFYQVLSISKDATENEIKRAYKKLALKLHPDKNNAPGAAEAFKIVGNAVSVLIDNVKRREYDAAGANSLEVNSTNARVNERNHRFYNPYDDDDDDNIYAEELFNLFFGACPNQRPANTRRNSHTESPHYMRPATQQQGKIAFGLIVLCIAISLVLSYLTNDPIYSLRQSSYFPIRRETTHLSVPYFVRKNFETDFQGSIARLEIAVEDDFIFTMKQNCFRERTYREAMLARARTFGNRLQFAQAQGLKMPSCENLARIGITRFSLY